VRRGSDDAEFLFIADVDGNTTHCQCIRLLLKNDDSFFVYRKSRDLLYIERWAKEESARDKT
jgi:hypothetical protein